MIWRLKTFHRGLLCSVRTMTFCLLTFNKIFRGRQRCRYTDNLPVFDGGVRPRSGGKGGEEYFLLNSKREHGITSNINQHLE